MKQSTKETLKPADITVKPTIKPKSENEPKDNAASGLKGKEKLIDDSEEDEPDEHMLKWRKAREAQIDEHNQIVREA